MELWVEMLHKFTEAADLIDAEKKMKKTMWGQFWSSHQRFFKYLCIASKVRYPGFRAEMITILVEKRDRSEEFS